VVNYENLLYVALWRQTLYYCTNRD